MLVFLQFNVKLRSLGCFSVWSAAGMRGSAGEWLSLLQKCREYITQELMNWNHKIIHTV